MGQTTDQIETHLETKQEDLRSNLEELEHKVKSVTDWRRQFRSNTGLMLGLAFGGGMLLARAMRRPRHGAARVSERLSTAASQLREPRRLDDRRLQLRQVWDDIQGALIAAATSKITATLAGAVPGFRERLGPRRAAARGGPASNGHGVQGEGDYEAARRYQSDAGKYVRSANIERAARAAAPRTEDEARELAEAEAAGRQRAKPS
jgi:hypothetical protein